MAENPCARCGATPAPFTTRADQLCSICFGNYIGIKVVKRMDHYRVGDVDIPKVLLALSFGPSSLALLHVLDAQVQRQLNKAGKTAYELHVLHVAEDDSHASLIEELRKLYPRYSYSTKQLLTETVMDAAILNADQPENISHLSASARSDLATKARDRLIAMTAQELSCSGILFGDSMTRLSERTLAETAQGRGFALSQLLGDSATIHGVPCFFPLRDIFRWELQQYTLHQATPLSSLMIAHETSFEYKANSQQPTSSKDLNINQLMSNYIAEVGQQYPNIVANVTRTGARLTQQSGQRNAACALCGFDIEIKMQEQSPRPGDVLKLSSNMDLAQVHCHGCLRSLYDRR